MNRLMFLTKESVLYFKKSIRFASVIYFMSISIGIFIFRNDRIPIDPKSLSFFELLFHNSLSVLLIIVTGLISFGLLGNFILIANGVILGRIFIGVFNNYGISPLLSNIAPHFLFETLALLIATSLSYETYKLYYNLSHTKRKVIRLRYCLIGILLIITFLIISALIESHLGG